MSRQAPEARLELEDEKDILNCGIEIKVQPPGKQLKTITLRKKRADDTSVWVYSFLFEKIKDT